MKLLKALIFFQTASNEKENIYKSAK